jgi:hypothetical protein
MRVFAATQGQSSDTIRRTVITPIEPTKEECPDMHTRAYPTFAQWFAEVWAEFQAQGGNPNEVPAVRYIRLTSSTMKDNFGIDL